MIQRFLICCISFSLCTVSMSQSSYGFKVSYLNTGKIFHIYAKNSVGFEVFGTWKLDEITTLRGTLMASQFKPTHAEIRTFNQYDEEVLQINKSYSIAMAMVGLDIFVFETWERFNLRPGADLVGGVVSRDMTEVSQNVIKEGGNSCPTIGGRLRAWADYVIKENLLLTGGLSFSMFTDNNQGGIFSFVQFGIGLNFIPK